jgi:DNA-binding beta-propeller fold protein YncE
MGRGRFQHVNGGQSDQRLGPELQELIMEEGLGGEYGFAPNPKSQQGFALSGRAVLGSWMLSFADGGAVDLTGLTRIEVQFDVDGFVPKGALTLRRVFHADDAGKSTDDMEVGDEPIGTVELTGPAPVGGTPVSLSSSHPDLVTTVQGVVAVLEGKTSASFAIRPLAPTGDQIPALTAKAQDGSTARFLVEIPNVTTPTVQRVPMGGAGRVNSVAALPGRTYVVTQPPAGSPDTAGCQVIALDDQLTEVARTTVGPVTKGVATDPTRNRIYLVDGGTTKAGITMLDGKTLEPLAYHELGAGLHDVAVDPAAGLVYVSHWISRRVFVLRADDLTRVGAIGDGTFFGALGLAVDPAIKRIYVARTYRAGEPNVEALSVIQRHATGEHTVDRTLPLGKLVQPWDVAVDVEAGLVYVLGLGGNTTPPQVVVFDRQSLDELGRVRVGGTPLAITARPGTGVAHVAVGMGVQVIDGRRLTVAAQIPGSPATSIAVGGPERVVSGSVVGELVRARDPKGLKVVGWR